MFTFHFVFYNPLLGCEDCVQFCAETKSEAEKLFMDFAIEEGISNGFKIHSIETVYNEYDAEEYGPEYRDPSEFKEEV